jgi:tripartite-type tricarboxylate transporter receptor subunit TctC
MADVPMFLDVAKTEADRQALDLALARLEFGRPFFMPPTVPPARVAAVRRAFDAAVQDKDFLAEAEKLKIEVDPLSGEQVASLIEKLYRTPPDIVTRVRTAMENK